MKKNIGTFDRIFRIAFAVIVGILFFTHVISGIIAIVLLSVAAIFLVTGLVSFCPLYFLFGLNSTGRKK